MEMKTLDTLWIREIGGRTFWSMADFPRGWLAYRRSEARHNFKSMLVKDRTRQRLGVDNVHRKYNRIFSSQRVHDSFFTYISSALPETSYRGTYCGTLHRRHPFSNKIIVSHTEGQDTGAPSLLLKLVYTTQPVLRLDRFLRLLCLSGPALLAGILHVDAISNLTAFLPLG